MVSIKFSRKHIKVTDVKECDVYLQSMKADLHIQHTKDNHIVEHDLVTTGLYDQ
jgi:hypothetical protein